MKDTWVNHHNRGQMEVKRAAERKLQEAKMETIPVLKVGDRIRVMNTVWAKEHGIENEKGVVKQVTADGDGCVVLLDREHLHRYNDIPSNQLMKCD